jgi:hypothetical protein
MWLEGGGSLAYHAKAKSMTIQNPGTAFESPFLLKRNNTVQGTVRPPLSANRRMSMIDESSSTMTESQRLRNVWRARKMAQVRYFLI